MRKKKSNHNKTDTSNQTAEFFSHPSEVNKAFTNVEQEKDPDKETESDAILGHYSDRDSQ